MCKYMHVHVSACLLACATVCVCVCVCLCECMPVCVCVFVCMCVHVCVTEAATHTLPPQQQMCRQRIQNNHSVSHLRDGQQVTASKPQNLSCVAEGSTHHHCLKTKLLVVVVDLRDTAYTCTHEEEPLIIMPETLF